MLATLDERGIVKQKKFGTGGPDVSVIGQGTWYLDRGDRKARWRRCIVASKQA